MAASTHKFLAFIKPQRRSDRSNGSLPLNAGTLAHGLPASTTCSARRNAAKFYWPVSSENWRRATLQTLSATRVASLTKIVSGWPQRSRCGVWRIGCIADPIPAKALGVIQGEVRCPHGGAQVFPPKWCDADADRKLQRLAVYLHGHRRDARAKPLRDLQALALIGPV